MRVSFHGNTFLNGLEKSVNSELQELQEKGCEIVDVRIGSNDIGYYAMIIYREG